MVLNLEFFDYGLKTAVTKLVNPTGLDSLSYLTFK